MRISATRTSMVRSTAFALQYWRSVQMLGTDAIEQLLRTPNEEGPEEASNHRWRMAEEFARTPTCTRQIHRE